jgi:hydroxyacyl-ACP dehydratase HTD2-like protein with hotdog domain
VRREKPAARVKSFSFRAVSPLIAGDRFEVRGISRGDEIDLWAANAQGGLAMEGKAVVG